MIEVDCRKCKNLSDNGCSLYGNDADIAVARCAENCFANYCKVKKMNNEELAKHKICSGDVVITPLGFKGIVIGIGENASGIWASVYLKEFDVPQMEPIDNIKYIGKHVNVLGFFNKAFIDIQEVKKNDS